MVVTNPNKLGIKLLICGCLWTLTQCCLTPNINGRELSRLDRELLKYVNRTFSVDRYNIIDGISIERKDNVDTSEDLCNGRNERSLSSIEDYIKKRFENYAKTHVVAIKMPDTARFFKFATGKSSFLTGFGLGFLAFGLKKLLLPLFIGAQIVKSVLIAMFLPSILGSLGKLVGKGLSQVSTVSGSSGHQQQQLEDFEFKDTTSYTNNDGEYMGSENSYNFNEASTSSPTDTNNKQAMNRFSQGGTYKRVSFLQPQSESYYIRQPSKQHDYKVFHKIPSSSLLLTTYDPFYSPLLSRLDAVFQQLGLGGGKGAEIERCRERLVCLMYANPAKYAPYSNLVSAQLSRELNELRKPSSDNPEILRFFRYMKAAKDGQDGDQCLAHGGCPALQASKPSPAMLTTFNDINKLVQARHLHT